MEPVPTAPQPSDVARTAPRSYKARALIDLEAGSGVPALPFPSAQSTRGPVGGALLPPPPRAGLTALPGRELARHPAGTPSKVPRYMFDAIELQVGGLAEKLTQLRRFL